MNSVVYSPDLELETRNSKQRPPAALFVSFAVTLLFLSSCASTQVTDRQQLVSGQLPRPGEILVYSFAATPTEVPPDSTLARHYTIEYPEQTPEQIQSGRALGAEIAEELAARIRDMGMPARHVPPGTPGNINDIVIRGCLASVNPGSSLQRVTIGFGAGASELATVAEGLQVTPQGLRQLGYGSVQSGGNKTPGAALGVASLAVTGNPVGLIVGSGMKVYGEASGSSTVEGRGKATAKEIAAILRERFQEQGWIQ